MMLRLCLCLALAVAGCANLVPQQRAALERAPVCCERYAQMPFEPLETGKTRSVRPGEGSPAFGFDIGKSWFYAGRLPPYTQPLVLSIDSHSVTVPRQGASVVRPAVLFLDERFEVTRAVAPEAFRRGSGADLRTSVFINPDNAQDAYLVLFADPREGDGETVKTFTPYTISLGGPPITLDGAEQTLPLAYSPAGTLTVQLERYEPRRNGD